MTKPLAPRFIVACFLYCMFYTPTTLARPVDLCALVDESLVLKLLKIRLKVPPSRIDDNGNSPGYSLDSCSWETLEPGKGGVTLWFRNSDSSRVNEQIVEAFRRLEETGGIRFEEVSGGGKRLWYWFDRSQRMASIATEVGNGVLMLTLVGTDVYDSSHKAAFVTLMHSAVKRFNKK